jgi:hypothetical protein
MGYGSVVAVALDIVFSVFLEHLKAFFDSVSRRIPKTPKKVCI